MLDTIITIISTIGVTLGGWKGVEYLINRKANKRIATSSADKSDIEVEKGKLEVENIRFEGLLEVNLKLNQLLESKTARIVELESKCDRLIDESLQKDEKHNKEIQELKLKIDELNNKLREQDAKIAALESQFAIKRCDVTKCNKRTPKNNY